MECQNTAEASLFLETLAPDGALTFMTLPDNKKNDALSLIRTLHGNYAKYRASLGKLNERGAGVFVMANRGDGLGRKKSNVQAIRAIFLDLDGAPIEPVLGSPVPPSIICETSEKRYHAYWPVSGMPLGEFRRAQQDLANLYSGDRAVCDLPRVMRVPGYIHSKKSVFTSRLVRCESQAPVPWPDLADALGLERNRQKVVDDLVIPQGRRNTELFRFACGLVAQGLKESEVFRRTAVANHNNCRPPLEAGEVEEIAASACRSKRNGYCKLDHRLLDSPEFRSMSLSGKTVVLALTRNYNGSNNGRVTFTRNDAEEWNLSRYKRTLGLEEAEASGFIERTARGAPAGPHCGATPDRFRLLFKPS